MGSLDMIESVKGTLPSELKREEKTQKKGQFRYLTDEILEIYRQMSEEENSWRMKYEEAAFWVYGTIPSHPIRFTEKGPKENVVQNVRQGHENTESDTCKRHYGEAMFHVFGTQPAGM